MLTAAVFEWAGPVHGRGYGHGQRIAFPGTNE